MSSPEGATVYTVPSKFIAYYPWGGPLSKDPDFEGYNRIVGIKPLKGRVIWAPRLKQYDANYYNKADAEEVQLPFNVVLTDRMARFFERFLTHRASETDYNCHRFGFWMEGIEVEEGTIADQLADEALESGKVKYDCELEIGQHALIGELSDHSDYYGLGAYHSVVGLGKDSDSCLQVIGERGNLGIMSWEGVAYRYSEDNLGLYLPFRK